MVKDVAVLSEENGSKNGPNSSAGPPVPPASLNVARLTSRAANNIDKKKRAVRAFKAGVKPEATKLFQAISKT